MNKNFITLTSAGESHGLGYTGIIQGLPANLEITLQEIQDELDRRKPGGKFATSRRESDILQITAGYYEGKTTGAPLSFFIANQNHQSKDYELLKKYYRPGHADVVKNFKYSHNDLRGGGQFSARSTVTTVVAGAFAKKILKFHGIEICGYVSQIGPHFYNFTGKKLDAAMIEQSLLRIPDPELSLKAEQYLEKIILEQNSVGSRATLHIYNCPVGLGTPNTEKINALISHALFSIPAVMGVNFGAAESAALALGSDFHDEISSIDKNRIHFKTNNHGGILGGLTSSAPIIVHAILKPPSSFSKERNFWNKETQQNEKISFTGRFDPVLAPRFIPVAEATLAMVILNQLYNAFGANLINDFSNLSKK